MTTITAEWVYRPETQAVCNMLVKDGAQAFFVGGCVRNTLLGAPVADIDITTDARPDRVIKLASQAGLKAVPTGIEHGTVTVVSDGVPHEITTFRRDVETDGRRAVVAFSTDIAEDAARRDFTMNALYAAPDGTIVDPLNGLLDLHARHVRFIGAAADRIREDYLRSLRYFRFHAWYGDASAGMDADALAAIAENLDGLSVLSRERVGSEMLKLLAAPDPAPSVASMRHVGVLHALLPGADDGALAPLIHLSNSHDAILRLASLGSGFEELLRLSKSDARRLDRLRHAAEMGDPKDVGYRLGAEEAENALALRAALLKQPLNDVDIATARDAADQVFPITAADLMTDLEGPALGAALRRLEADWVASGFELTRENLIAKALDQKEG